MEISNMIKIILTKDEARLLQQYLMETSLETTEYQLEENFAQKLHDELEKVI